MVYALKEDMIFVPLKGKNIQHSFSNTNFFILEHNETIMVSKFFWKKVK